MGKKKKDSTTNRQLIAAREKEGKALQLRLNGETLADIAKQVGYRDHTGAKAAIERAMVRLGKPEKAEEMRELEIRRLDRFLVSICRAIETMPNLSDQLAAMDRGLKIMERRAKMCGLDAAEKHQDIPYEANRVAGMDPKEWATKRLRQMTGENNGGIDGE